MCGIVGFISKREDGASTTEAKVLRELAAVDVVRGYDGTGMFYYKEKPGKDKTRLWWLKEAETATEFLTKNSWEAHALDAQFVVVHNRASTVGGDTHDNTHPFIETNVLGVHNGTVHGWRAIDANAKMDSHALIKMLSDEDPDPAHVGRLLGGATIEAGAYSLVWWDHRIDRLRFARNTSRPMTMASTYGAVWFASELRMLEWILERNSQTIITSWVNEPYTLIDVPLCGGEAEVYNYESSLDRWGTFRKNIWNSWEDAWDNEPRVKSPVEVWQERYANGGGSVNYWDDYNSAAQRRLPYMGDDDDDVQDATYWTAPRSMM